MALAPEILASLRAAGERARQRDAAEAARPTFRQLMLEGGRRCRYFVTGGSGPDGRCCGEPAAGSPGELGASYCRDHLGRLVNLV